MASGKVYSRSSRLASATIFQSMNIALGSATLIRMAKLGCGSPALAFIGSHSGRGNDSAGASRNLPTHIGAQMAS
jgi:hypothetical protein